MARETKTLVLVESKAKAATIKKILGPSFEVMACFGHIRDLIPKKNAVDPAQNFSMHYMWMSKNESYLKKIAATMNRCQKLFLASDEDREGEAIAYDLLQYLMESDTLKKKEYARIVFNQITKKAIQYAVAHPRDIDMNLVHAQKARRALDYLVGFHLSPLLWKKIQRNLSAGRVQSVALRMIAEREQAIREFVSRPYWTVHADLLDQNGSFKAQLIQYHRQKIEQFFIESEEHAKNIVSTLSELTHGGLKVQKITTRNRKRQPAAPFITATLQQEAGKKLGFSAKKTMQIAQQLYEGIQIDEEMIGLITYMRTDSVMLAEEALDEIRHVIEEQFGAQAKPEKARSYKVKSKNAQEAHEAIRPTVPALHPNQMKKNLNTDQWKLYHLIWCRTMACQMIDAVFQIVSIDLSISDHVLRSSGSTVLEAGFMRVYQDSSDLDEKNVLPIVKEGQMIPVARIYELAHTTEPPSRFSESSLIKMMEECGIGRPSTYATIIETLKKRGYVVLEHKSFVLQDIGQVVSSFLTHYFAHYVDYHFTAQLEDSLDVVALGERDWIAVLQEFWEPFRACIDTVDRTVERKMIVQETLQESCPKCNQPLLVRLGKTGRFVGCSAYPECTYTRDLDSSSHNNAIQAEAEPLPPCTQCGGETVLKHGPYGPFIGCSQYPQCKKIVSLKKFKDTGVICPKCQKGALLEKRSKRGKIFYSCAQYPTCDYALWYAPIPEPCPQCGWSILLDKSTKKFGRQKTCPQESCGYTIPFPELPTDDRADAVIDAP